MGKGAKSRATAQRTVSEEKAGKMDGRWAPLPSFPAFFRLFPGLRFSLLSERLGQAKYLWSIPWYIVISGFHCC